MLTIVTGPPCAGKSTYIEKRAKFGDIVVDLDRLALALTTEDTPHHGYHKGIRWVAIAARRAALDAAIKQHHQGAQVWAIDTDPSPRRREFYRRAGARIVDIDPGIDVVLGRAQGQRPAHVIAYIHDWYEGRAHDASRSRTW
jgi:hypothetical protein